LFEIHPCEPAVAAILGEYIYGLLAIFLDEH